MILSSADIARVLSADAIISREAKVSIVEGKPGIGWEETVYIYIDKYPTIDEFEATWKIWVQDQSDMGQYVLNALTNLLPNFTFEGSHYSTKDIATNKTVTKPQTEIDREQVAKDRARFKTEFSSMQKGLQQVIGNVRDGVDGRDGKDGIDGINGRDGKDGRDGRDGKDIEASETELEDLANVEEGIAKEAGQVLTWDGSKWTNLYTRQSYSPGGSAGGGGGGEGGGVTRIIAGDNITISPANGVGVVTINAIGGGGGQCDGVIDGGNVDSGESNGVDCGGGGIEEAPEDGTPYVRQDAAWIPAPTNQGGIGEEAPIDGGFYVRHMGQWVNIEVALGQLGVIPSLIQDGGDFDTGDSEAGYDSVVDGGDFD